LTGISSFSYNVQKNLHEFDIKPLARYKKIWYNVCNNEDRMELKDHSAKGENNYG
jgi:hypothetical protein